MKMKKLLLFAGLLVFCQSGSAQAFENAQSAVKNMKIGWNAGNRLDSNSGDVNNMWIEAWTDRKPENYETAWGQPQITRELIHMFKEAGFNAIRVPVTWYPHMGSVIVDPSKTDWKAIWDNSTWTGYDIDKTWMARVHEVVDYVIDEGMYCILNVHHDTGDGSTAWLRASEDTYNKQRERFESLWTQIATEFRDYDEHLLFEGYNEMLDDYGSWCFASFSAPGNYNATVAKSAYNAINSYAQSFVNAVRATGGNNASRNLVVNTYGACCGEGNWNSHLADPLKEMRIPDDSTEGHIIFEVHSYPSPTTVSAAKSDAESLVSTLKKHLIPKGAPVILGEWGLSTKPSLSNFQEIFCAFARSLVSRAKEEGIGTMLWMVLADGDDCNVPQWSNPELKDAIVKGYYGDNGYQSGISQIDSDNGNIMTPTYNAYGVKVSEASVPGIYIKNGKKFIVK